VPLVLELGGQPILGVLGLHEPELAEQPVGHHGPRLADHRVAGVVVGQHEHAARTVDQLGELPRLLQARGQRLVADDVDAALEERLGGVVVEVVRRHDRHHVDAVVRALALALGHLVEVAVAALGCEPQRRPARLGPLGRGGERARHQLVAVVEPRRDAVHRADERPLAAAHHAEPQPAPPLARLRRRALADHR
jgi:hypothetical protein